MGLSRGAALGGRSASDFFLFFFGRRGSQLSHPACGGGGTSEWWRRREKREKITREERERGDGKRRVTSGAADAAVRAPAMATIYIAPLTKTTIHCCCYFFFAEGGLLKNYLLPPHLHPPTAWSQLDKSRYWIFFFLAHEPICLALRWNYR